MYTVKMLQTHKILRQKNHGDMTKIIQTDKTQTK